LGEISGHRRNSRRCSVGFDYSFRHLASDRSLLHWYVLFRVSNLLCCILFSTSGAFLYLLSGTAMLQIMVLTDRHPQYVFGVVALILVTFQLVAHFCYGFGVKILVQLRSDTSTSASPNHPERADTDLTNISEIANKSTMLQLLSPPSLAASQSVLSLLASHPVLFFLFIGAAGFAALCGGFFFILTNSYMLLASFIFLPLALGCFFMFFLLWRANNYQLFDNPRSRNPPLASCFPSFWCCGLTVEDYARFLCLFFYFGCLAGWGAMIAHLSGFPWLGWGLFVALSCVVFSILATFPYVYSLIFKTSVVAPICCLFRFGVLVLSFSCFSLTHFVFVSSFSSLLVYSVLYWQLAVNGTATTSSLLLLFLVVVAPMVQVLALLVYRFSFFPVANSEPVATPVPTTSPSSASSNAPSAPSSSASDSGTLSTKARSIHTFIYVLGVAIALLIVAFIVTFAIFISLLGGLVLAFFFLSACYLWLLSNKAQKNGMLPVLLVVFAWLIGG
jgi:hypothetical protein